MRFISRLVVISALLVMPLIIVAPAGAAPFNPFEKVCTDVVNEAGVCPEDGTRDPITGANGIILSAVRILSFIVGVASIIMIIVGGLKYIMSNGDSNSVTAAKNTILYAIIGLAVFAVSQTIVEFVISRI
jgi:hypothetical protein